MAKSPSKAKSKPTPAAPSRPPLLEWIMAGLGLVMVLVAFAMILVEALDGPAAPADVVVTAGRVRPVPGGFVVEVRARNTGGNAVADVQIEGRLGDETGAVAFDYLPAHGDATGAMRVHGDPSAGLELSVLGWREP